MTEHQQSTDLQRRNAILTRMLEVSLVLNSNLALKPLLTYIMEEACAITEAEAASVLLYDRKTDELRFVASMSPGVTASSETANVTWTTRDSPAFRFTRANPRSRLGGAITSLTGWCTYTGTTVVPARLPVFLTVTVTSTVPLRRTVPPTDSPLVANVV